MKRIATVIGCLAVGLLLATPGYAQLGNEGPNLPVDLVRPPARDLDPVNPIPRPIAPPTTFTSDEMQLVGFTRQHLAGNEGLLNMSIACQREFLGSRMCTLDEITRTLFIPEALGVGYAWTHNPGPGGAPEQNCNGWMSNSVDHVGTTIELGECYGGMAMKACDSRLAVACCATSGTTVVR